MLEVVLVGTGTTGKVLRLPPFNALTSGSILSMSSCSRSIARKISRSLLKARVLPMPAKLGCSPSEFVVPVGVSVEVVPRAVPGEGSALELPPMMPERS